MAWIKKQIPHTSQIFEIKADQQLKLKLAFNDVFPQITFEN